ncbi:MAG: HAD family phosphatase [Clostridia bacterium]|nr:HAD family phosphatase [Clostridia bacterium]
MNLMIDDKYASMPWDEIDAVVFDIGNVLLRYIPAELLEKIVPERPDLHDDLTVRIFRSPYWCMLDHGTITIDEAIEAMSSGDDAILPYVARVMRGWFDLEPIEEGVAALRACKAHGKKVYALSNYPAEGISYIWNKLDFFRLFDEKVISSHIQMVKPGHAIYEHLIARFGLTPSRTLFIDDTPGNIEAAMHCGWQGLCVNKHGKLAAFFAK